MQKTPKQITRWSLLQLDGTIIAPTSSKDWGSGLLQWLEFTKLRGITIQGSGIIEGRGTVWWTDSESDVDPVSILFHLPFTWLQALDTTVIHVSFQRETH